MSEGHKKLTQSLVDLHNTITGRNDTIEDITAIPHDLFQEPCDKEDSNAVTCPKCQHTQRAFFFHKNRYGMTSRHVMQDCKSCGAMFSIWVQDSVLEKGSEKLEYDGEPEPPFEL
jgi:DNA-directed RNA polymerase subunit M/transcription elongation factor TFIIS